MSRCFPFPPPGYRARDEALIKSIKLREEMEKAEKDRREKKEKKREKKERKRAKKEKKERRKEEKKRKLKEGTSTSRGTDDGKKFKLINELKETKADGKLQKGEHCENEQLERSGITEELDQPVTSVEPCCLSDSTQSSKRKRSSPESTHDHGSAIKIRVPLRKHREPEDSKSKSKFQVGSSSGCVGATSDSFTKTTLGSDLQSQCLRITKLKRVLGNSDSRHGKAMQNSVHGDVVVTKNTIGSDRQSQCHRTTEPKRVPGNSGKVMQNSVHGDAAVIKNTIGSDRQSQDAMVTYNAVDDGSHKVESLYESLLQIPPLTYGGLDSAYEDWLFSSELKESGPVSKKKKCDSDVFQLSNSMWPRAQYLPEVEVYALPYAVPF